MFEKKIEGRQQGWRNPCPRRPINPQYHGLIKHPSPTTRSDVSHLFHRARCDSDDGSRSSSIGKVPRLVEREIIDSSDEESQASSGSFEERMKGDYFVGQVFVPTRMKRMKIGVTVEKCKV